MALRLLALLSSLLFAFNLACNSDIKGSYPISLVVYNSFKDENVTYMTKIAYRGILLGAMKTLQATTSTFNFTVTEDLNYGPFLVSVNGVAGCSANHTYWQLLAQLPNGTTITPDVGVGCYIPNLHDTIILKFTKW